MKRSFSFFMIIALLLTGCAQKDCPALPPPEQKPLSEEDVQQFYAAAAQVYDWFDLTTMPLDESDAQETSEGTYYRVNSTVYPELSSLSALQKRVEDVFSPDIAEYLFSLSPDHYRDIGGKLYAQPGARGTNIYLLDKTVTAEPVDDSHWTVTLTFWADSWAWERPSATVGYSQKVLDYERQADGQWRFTSFRPSDGLDLEADTVFTFSYDPDTFDSTDFDTYSDLRLVLYLLHADGAYAEAPSDLLYHRFVERPDEILKLLTMLDTSPYQESHPQADAITASPGYHAAWLSKEEQAEFLSALDSCQAETEAEQAVLERIRAAYEDTWEDVYYAPFCMVAEGQYLTLGPQEGAFPWGHTLDEVSRETGGGDGFGTVYTVDCGTLTLRYNTAGESGEFLYLIDSSTPGVRTIAGVGVGDTEEDILAAYPTAAFAPGWDGRRDAWVYPGDGEMLGSHITFCMEDGRVVRIVMEHIPC